MTAQTNTLLERLAIELGTHMINIQIANLESEDFARMKIDSDAIIEGMKNRIINLEVDIKALRAEVIAFRDKEISQTKKNSAVVVKK